MTIKTPKNQSQEDASQGKLSKETAGSIPAPDTLRGSSDEEILKEVLSDKTRKVERADKWVLRMLRKAISLTRKACEKKDDIESIKRNMIWQREGYEDGQQAERERILEIIDKL